MAYFSGMSSVDSWLRRDLRSSPRPSFCSSTQNSSTLLFRYPDMSLIAPQQYIYKYYQRLLSRINKYKNKKGFIRTVMQIRTRIFERSGSASKSFARFLIRNFLRSPFKEKFKNFDILLEFSRIYLNQRQVVYKYFKGTVEP